MSPHHALVRLAGSSTVFNKTPLHNQCCYMLPQGVIATNPVGDKINRVQRLIQEGSVPVPRSANGRMGSWECFAMI